VSLHGHIVPPGLELINLLNFIEMSLFAAFTLGAGHQVDRRCLCWPFSRCNGKHVWTQQHARGCDISGTRRRHQTMMALHCRF